MNLNKAVIKDPLGRNCRVKTECKDEDSMYEILNLLLNYDDSHYIYRVDNTLYYDYEVQNET